MKTPSAVSASPRRACSLPLKLSLLALTLAALGPVRAEAHQYWLAPSRYDPARGEAITLGAIAGTGFRGEKKPWSPDRTVRLVARTSRVIDLSPAATFGEESWLRFAPADDGGTMLAFESGFTPIELPAAAFDAYLADEGLAVPLAARRAARSSAPGRERYRRCAKAWLAGSDGARASAPVGMPLELVPLSAPGAASSLVLRVLWNGRPLAGATLKTWRAVLAPDGGPSDGAVRDSIPMVWQGRTDARGEVAMPCAKAGEWMASVVHMEPSRDRTAADWESTWASLTFLRRESGSAAR
jgi:uncharacterized GH25 family protein